MDHILGNINLLTLAPVLNLQLLIDGILIGAVFALAAYGLALVWGVMNVKNLAQGDFVIMGGYICWWLYEQGMHPVVGIISAIIFMWIFGWLVFIFIIKQVIERDLFTSLLATFGLAIMIAQILNILFTSDTQTINLGDPSIQLFDGAVTVAPQKFYALLVAVFLATVIISFMKFSRMGQAIRATAQDPRAARVMGINTDQIYAFTFSLNAAICGAAGALIAMIWVIQPFYGITYSIRSFVIVTAAGFGNLPGVIGASFGISAIEQYGGFILGAEFQQAIVVGMLILVLAVRIFLQRRKRQVVQ